MSQEVLHTLIDKVEESLDTIRQNQEVITEEQAKGTENLKKYEDDLTTMRATMEDMRSRLDVMDSILPKGEKVYAGPLSDRDEKSRRKAVREELGKFMYDIASWRMTGQPRYNSDSFKRAQTGGVPEEGGFLVDEEQANEIVDIIEDVGVARECLRIVPMNKKVLRFPVRVSGPDVFWQTPAGQVTGSGPGSPGGGAVTKRTDPSVHGNPASIDTGELSTPGEQTVEFGREELVNQRLIAIDTLSIDIDDDSMPSIMDFIVDIFGRQIAKEEDFQAFASDGVGEPFTGLLNDGTIGTATGAGDGLAPFTIDEEISYDVMLDLMNAVDENVVANSKFIFNHTALLALRKVKDSSGQPIFGPFGMAAGGMTEPHPQTIFGLPYILSNVFPKTLTGSGEPIMLFGDFSYHVMGDRETLSMDVSEHAAWREAGLVLRVTERVGFKLLLSSPIARLLSA